MVGSTLPSNVLLDQYEIKGVLGSGGFAITYLALDHSSGDLVAIKEFFPRDLAVRGSDGSVLVASYDARAEFGHSLERFWEEAEVLARFSHPNIVRVLARL